MARAKNPRRIVLPVLQDMKHWLNDMTNVWGGSQQTYDIVEIDHYGRKFRNAVYRSKRADEKPENSIQEWLTLISYMEGVRGRASNVIALASEQIRKLEEAQRNDPAGERQS